MNNNDTVLEKYDICIVQSKRNNINSLKVNNLYLHSRYNPIEEAEKISASSYKKNYLHILFGFGLGYIAHALLKKMGDTDQLLIIEPNVELFKLTIERKENQEFINNNKVKFCVGLDSSNLENLLNTNFQSYFGRFTIISSPNYTKLYPDYYKFFLEKAKEHLMMEVINNNTRHIFSQQWQKNFISNLYPAFLAHNLEVIKGKLDCPVIITSGGPSLTKQLPLLKKMKDHAYVICAGSTINTLLNEEIIPDLIVTVDGGEPNFNHFKNIKIDHIPLAYPLIVHKGIPLEHKGEHIVFNISDHTKTNIWTNKLLSKNITLVQTGHSVANFSLDIALQVTSGPICIIGQDLAYSNNQTHALGNVGFSIIDEEKKKQRKMFITEGYYGDGVLTDYVFHGMKKGFEHQINKLREKGCTQKIYNATEGGVKIHGFEQISFNNFIEQFCKKNVREEVNKLLPPKEIPNPERWKEFYNEMQKLLKQYKDVLLITEKSLSVLNKVKKNNFQFNSKFNEKIDEYDKELKKLLENEFIHYILRPIIFKIQHSYLESENESYEERNKRIYHQSYLLYEGIKTATQQGLNWLTDIIKRVEINL
jgi:hypothetical protein